MSRIYVMTLGLFLIFLGIQAFLVKAYVLTPEATRFVAERFENPDAASTVNNFNSYSPFNQAGYQPNYGQTYNQVKYSMASPAQRSIAPPSWLCWPIFFLGAVVFLHGLALRGRD